MGLGWTPANGQLERAASCSSNSRSRRCRRRGTPREHQVYAQKARRGPEVLASSPNACHMTTTQRRHMCIIDTHDIHLRMQNLTSCPVRNVRSFALLGDFSLIKMIKAVQWLPTHYFTELKCVDQPTAQRLPTLLVKYGYAYSGLKDHKNQHVCGFPSMATRVPLGFPSF